MKEIEEQIILDVLDYLPGWTIHPISRPTEGQPRTFLRNDPLDPHKDFEENEIHFGKYDLYDGVVDDNQHHTYTENNPQLDDTINDETSESSQQNTTLDNNNTNNQETTPNTYTKQYNHKPKHNKHHPPETYDPEDYDTYNTRKHIPPHEILHSYKKTIYQAASYLNREKVPNTQICYHAIIMWTAGKLQEQYNNTNENPSNLIREAKEMIIPYYNPNYHGLHTQPRIRTYDPFIKAPHHHHQNKYKHRTHHEEEILKHLYDDYMYLEPVTGERGDVLKINCELRGIKPEPGDKIKFILEE